MYDRRLDAIIAAEECGSFSRAAQRLHLSATAVIKQIAGFEHEYGLTLFDRTNNGVTPTASGRALIEDARGLIRQSERSLQHARQLERTAGEMVRLAVSMLRPATPLLELWPRASVWLTNQGRHVSLELVSLADGPDGFMTALDHLGEDVDMTANGFSPGRREHDCNVLKLGEYPLRMGVPLSNQLSVRSGSTLHLNDLEGQRIHIPAPGVNDAMDRARAVLSAVPGVTLIDMRSYTFDDFNACAASGDLILARTFGTGIHPMIRPMPVDWDLTIAYGLFYPKEPSAAVQAFVDAIGAVLQ
ncbi:LysR family transcriptional regulator [Bifidobacterium simiiventris]|uniref:LysR family transcriptional regulator n=1 Tax=Bifidobacterium simiiventris TaxID=2834434 RepID=UPI001C5987F7|nr:LysR family transcriptional regulator [Bifidobacterium simiiventris]MBW3078430.1 LysR family transcriptional regulator [Bifidobacterium simiiventris]